MLHIDLSRDAAKFLQKLTPKHRRQVAGKIFMLSETPLMSDTRELRGHAAYRRADIGEYRIIYSVAEPFLKVLLIGKRNDDEVYRRFGRKYGA